MHPPHQQILEIRQHDHVIRVPLLQLPKRLRDRPAVLLDHLGDALLHLVVIAFPGPGSKGYRH